MNILFYTPLNSRCLDIESQAIEFNSLGHNIFLLTQTERAENHDRFESHGFTVTAKVAPHSSTIITTIKRIWDLVLYCRTYKIDLVYSHLEPANFVAVLAQYLMNSRVVICRHHVDAAKLYSFNNNISYKLTYKLAKDVIVVSKRAKEFMIKEEGVLADRIHVFPLSYNFDLYEDINEDIVAQIRSKYSCQILLLSVFRLTKYKRPTQAILVLKKLLQTGVDAKLVILGRGEEEFEINKLIKENKLEDRIVLEGYVKNVLDYMAAADFLVHPSLLDSSSIVLKESAIVNLPIIACSGVGDFDEVIEDKVNGFLVSPNDFINDTVAIIHSYSKDKVKLTALGSASEMNVRKRFNIKVNKEYYENLFHIETALTKER